MTANPVSLAVFLILFAAVAALGFLSTRWRKADLHSLHEWGLGGRSFGRLGLGLGRGGCAGLGADEAGQEVAHRQAQARRHQSFSDSLSLHGLSLLSAFLMERLLVLGARVVGGPSAGSFGGFVVGLLFL